MPTPPAPHSPAPERAPRRALATVETITEIGPIADADAIVRARVRGWDVVVKLDEFTVGDPCVYFEVDTLLEVADPRFEFLAPRGVRTDGDGAYGHVLKTARLRGQYSQGLALPLSAFPELADAKPGDDVTDLLPLVKWDPPIPAEIAGAVRGPRPSWIAKTDEERVQNLAEVLHTDVSDWLPTEKIDGTSTTFFVDPQTGVDGVCTREWDLLPNDKTLWRLARELEIHDLLRVAFPGQRVAVQGETYGFGIQGNPLQLKDQRWSAFNLRVGDHDVPRAYWPLWLLDMSVPVRDDIVFPATVDDALTSVEGLASLVNPARPAEGVVWRSATREFARCADGRLVRASYKVVSNRYLLKHDR